LSGEKLIEGKKSFFRRFLKERHPSGGIILNGGVIQAVASSR